MKDEDKFEAAHQEIVDAHTGATITFGTHAGSGHRWCRIAVPYPTPDGRVETRTSTVTFGPDGHALKMQPHVVALPGVTVDESPREIEKAVEDSRFDKSSKRDKK